MTGELARELALEDSAEDVLFRAAHLSGTAGEELGVPGVSASALKRLEGKAEAP